jgi:predicted peroxiredoxin
MSRFFFIQSQDPFVEVRARAQFDLARRLAAAGNDVSVLFIQNGVSVSRISAAFDEFQPMRADGVKLFADAFSLKQRDIDFKQLKKGIVITGIGVVIDALIAGDKVIWN